VEPQPPVLDEVNGDVMPATGPAKAHVIVHNEEGAAQVLPPSFITALLMYLVSWYPTPTLGSKGH
jgi:hypothetical protein